MKYADHLRTYVGARGRCLQKNGVFIFTADLPATEQNAELQSVEDDFVIARLWEVRTETPSTTLSIPLRLFVMETRVDKARVDEAKKIPEGNWSVGSKESPFDS